MNVVIVGGDYGLFINDQLQGQYKNVVRIERDSANNTSRHVNFGLAPFVRLPCGEGAACFIVSHFRRSPNRYHSLVSTRQPSGSV